MTFTTRPKKYNGSSLIFSDIRFTEKSKFSCVFPHIEFSKCLSTKYRKWDLPSKFWNTCQKMWTEPVGLGQFSWGNITRKQPFFKTKQLECFAFQTFVTKFYAKSIVKKVETEWSGGKFTFIRSLPCILSSATSINHEKMANTIFSKFLQKACLR